MLMGIDGQGSQLDTNLIINNENEVEEAVLDDLSVLKNDVVAETENNVSAEIETDIVSEAPEQLSHAEAEQYYALGKTQVEHGDLQNVNNAINNHTDMKDARISILGGADELFMSEQKGQQILDEEVSKLHLLEGGFSGPNLTMLDQLILDLTNESNHTELASRYPRNDGKSNVGNAKLIAARIASGYVEVFTTIQQKIQDTDTAVSISYTIDWDQCVIGNGGANLSDRKIQVEITMHMDEVVDDMPSNDGEVVPTSEEISLNSQSVTENVQSPSDSVPVPEAGVDVVDKNTNTIVAIEHLQNNLITKYNALKIASSKWVANPYVFGGRFDKTTYPDRHVLKVSENNTTVLEVGIYTSGPNTGMVFIGLGDVIYEKGKNLNVGVLASQDVFDQVVAYLKNKQTVEKTDSRVQEKLETKQEDVAQTKQVDVVAPKSQNVAKPKEEKPQNTPVAVVTSAKEETNTIQEREKISEDIATAQVIVGEGNTIDFAKHNALLQIVSAVSGSLDKKDVVGGKDYVILDQTALPQSDGSYRYSISYKILPPEYITDEVVDSGSSQVVETRENIDIPFVYGSREWLASKLTGKLEGISLEQFYNCLEGNSISINYSNPYNKEPLTIHTTLPGIDNPVLRDKVLSYIDRGDIRGMYEDLYGMHENIAINPYLHYRPSGVINPLMLHAMSLRLWQNYDIVDNKEQLDRMKMPDDVRKAWKDYKKLKLHLLSENNGPNNFAIVSKTDFSIYLFLPDGTLVGKQNVVLGKNPSDTERLVSNTPSGKYKTNGFFNKPGFNAKYYDKGLGNYIKLWSLEDRFKNVQSHDAGIGVHELYDPAKRAAALLDDVTRDPLVRDRKRMSDGCINASNSPLAFGALFTHLVPKSDIATCVYVTPSPDETAVSRYYSMLQSQAPIAMK